MEGIIDYITGDAFWWLSSILVVLLSAMTFFIGYTIGKGRMWEKCQCDRPLPHNRLLICKDCDKRIEI